MHPRRNPDVKTTLLPDGHIVLFDEKTNWAMTLNPMGALIWEFCDGNHTASQIEQEITSLTDQHNDLDQNIESLLKELSESGLIIG